MDGILFALSLEVALLQFHILDGCMHLKSQHQQKLGKKTERLQREKLLKDRETIKDVLRSTLIEVSESGECRTLETATEYLNQRESSAMNKKLDQEKLTISLEKITDNLNIKRKKWQADIQEMDSKIPVLRDKINEDSFNVNVTLRYAQKWLLASAESSELEYNVQRPPVPRIDHEQRVHKELLKAYKLQTKEHEHSLEHWQQRYSTDVTNITKKLKLIMELLRFTSNRRIKLQEIYNLHEGEIRGWLTFKRERAARLERKERQRASATRIQAWWRGVMVRRALGSFKHLRNAKKSAIKSKKKYSLFQFP